MPEHTMMSEEMRNSLAYKTFMAGWNAVIYTDNTPEEAYVAFVKELATDPRYPLDRHQQEGHN